MDEINFPFCPKCAHPVIHRGHFTHCEKCGADFYVNPRPCNAIIITNSKGEILLTKRAFDPAAGLWDLPGGFIDIGETAEESVVREGREELGVTLEHIHYLCSGPDRYLFKGVNYHTLGFVFTARIAAGQTPTPHDDVAELCFFAPQHIPAQELACPILRSTIAHDLCVHKTI